MLRSQRFFEIILTMATIAALILTPAFAKPPDGKGGGNGGGGGGEDPPSNPEIAYIEDCAIWVMNADGSNQTQVFGGSDICVYWVSWSPDGTQFAINADINGTYGLWTINADGSNLQLVRSLHFFAAYGSQPRWSPAPTVDGHHKIGFVTREFTGTDDIAMISPDGSGLVHLVDTPGIFEDGCAWSPDASRIAVWGAYVNGVIIYDLGLVDGSLAVVGETEVPNVPAGIGFVDWARTQDKLVAKYCCDGVQSTDLLIIDLNDPTSRVWLTSNDVDEGTPTWSPDDTYLVCERAGRGKDAGIRKLSVDGQSDEPLGAKFGWRPDWKRAAPPAAAAVANDATACPDDLNGDGRVDERDLVALLTSKPVVAGERISDLLQSWGDCP